ncbi:MAG: ATP-dependent zinc protease [Deltaproteobacteria bacterium]|nr:ATP-dependent zinc protease [Deltaproteobacteria bacterium]
MIQAQKLSGKKFFIPLFLVIAGFVLQSCATQPSKPTKVTVGATEIIHIVEADLDFLTRIDTGARTTSIHALEIEIESPAKKKRANVGKKISLTLINGKGEKKRLHTTIVDALQVRNAQGVEVRYMIPLTLRWQGIDKTINVNLRNRSAMTYKLLIGRDWLSQDFIVDVDVNKNLKK